MATRALVERSFQSRRLPFRRDHNSRATSVRCTALARNPLGLVATVLQSHPLMRGGLSMEDIFDPYGRDSYPWDLVRLLPSTE